MVRWRVGFLSLTSSGAFADSSGVASRLASRLAALAPRASTGRELRSAALGICWLSLLSVPISGHGQKASATAAQTIVGASGLNHPSAVAVDDKGNVFAADTGNNRVVEIPVG